MARSADADFRLFRAAFPGANDGPYLNVADCGIMSRHVRQALDRYLDGCLRGGDRDAAARTVEAARSRFAALVRARPGEVALVKNVSDGINAFANAVDWRSGDNVVLCDGLEHPSNRYPWYNLRDRAGVSLRTVSGSKGHIDAGRILSKIDRRTRVVSVSMVTFAPGFRTDLAEIGAECRRRDVILVADAAQSVGVLDVDARKLCVDVIAAGTPKALLGLYGLGFLYVRGELNAELRPAGLSRAGVDEDRSRGGSRIVLKRGAARFDLGNHNLAGCVAASASIAQLLDLGTARIERHVLRLSRRLDSGLRELGLPVFDPGTHAARSHIVSVGTALEDDLDSTSDRTLLDLHDHLASRGIVLSVRRGVLRFAMHAYNDDSDIDRVLDAIRAWCRWGGRRRTSR